MRISDWSSDVCSSDLTSVNEKQKRVNQLRIIVQLRNFERQFKIAMSKAATFFKEEKDPFYKMGAEKERAKAYAEKLNMARSEEHTSELQSLMRISYAVL